jgi:hypothetical protein
MAILIRRGIIPPVVAGGGGGSPAYVYRGQFNNGSGSTNFGASTTIGADSADRLVIVAVMATGATGETWTVTVGSTGLTQAVILESTDSVAIFSGVVPTGGSSQTITITATSNPNIIQAQVWTATGLSSNTVKHTGSGTFGSPGTISVTGPAGNPSGVGDFMFAIGRENSGAQMNWSGSTQTPTGEHDGFTANLTGSDWIISATNASFSLTAGNAFAFAAATFI